MNGPDIQFRAVGMTLSRSWSRVKNRDLVPSKLIAAKERKLPTATRCRAVVRVDRIELAWTCAVLPKIA